MTSSSPCQRQAIEPVHVYHESQLHRLGVWSEQEWTDLPVESRPWPAINVPGLGWVGLTPIREPHREFLTTSPPDRRQVERRRAFVKVNVERRRGERRRLDVAGQSQELCTV